MHPSSSRIQRAWEGRISGCMLGKPVEGLSMRKGPEVLLEQLKLADALPLRNYVPDAGTGPDDFFSIGVLFGSYHSQRTR